MLSQLLVLASEKTKRTKVNFEGFDYESNKETHSAGHGICYDWL